MVNSLEVFLFLAYEDKNVENRIRYCFHVQREKGSFSGFYNSLQAAASSLVEDVKPLIMFLHLKAKFRVFFLKD